MNDTIGIFYEMPNGRIVKTYAWNGGANTIHYYTEDHVAHTVGEEEWSTWTPRRDVSCFEHANDPLLPHIFLLLWGLERWSDLSGALSDGHENIDMIRDAMRSHGITEREIEEKLKK
jgi:hypothetical protein